MNCSKVDSRNSVIGNEVSPNLGTTGIELFLFWHRLPVKPFEPNFEEMIFIDGFNVASHFGDPILYKLIVLFKQSN